MAELTTIEAKLGEVIGLAMAAQDATEGRPRGEAGPKHDHSSSRSTDGAGGSEAEPRGTAVAETLDRKKTAIMKEARSVRTKARDMMSTTSTRADALDGFEFLTMAEAGEVGHWSVLDELNQKARDRELGELPQLIAIQQRHLKNVDGGLAHARLE